MPTANYEQAEPSNLTKAQVSSLAEALAKKLQFGPGDNIKDLVARLGGQVRVEDTLTEDPERTGSLFVESPTNFAIVVPTHTSERRDRFTVAHELGHFLLHYIWRRQQAGATIGPMMALRRGSDRLEWEANWFAGAFLMPAADFRSAHEQFGGSMSSVAEHFQVSVSAAKVRARHLGLADDVP